MEIHGSDSSIHENESEVCMMSVQLKATLREDLRNSATNQLRKDGFIPAVVYGKNQATEAIAVDNVELVKLLRDNGRNAIISLVLEGNNKLQVMLHDYQNDPIRNELVHVDFFKVDMTEEMDVEVPIHLEGEPIGAKEGGVLQQPLYVVQVRAMPNEIPEEITVDVSELQIGDSISVADLPTAGTYTLTDEPDTLVVSVLPPEVEEEETDEAESVEPELVDADAEDEE